MINIEHVLPQDIEHRSFEIIEEELNSKGIVLDAELSMVIKRAIHTTADFDYANTLVFSDNALAIAKELIRNGAYIVTDTNMALAGINKKELAKYGAQALCYMADEEVAREASVRHTTRASISMERASRLDKPVIFVVGNAPTALISLKKMMEDNLFTPAFVIGVPVGFVNVEAAKELIIDSRVPHIVNRGRKGGSNVAAAIMNAILYLMRDENNQIRETQEVNETKKMRYGFTTGSCSAAAAKAAVYMLLSGKRKENITLITPKGIEYNAQITDITNSENEVSCCVIKDGGDDPDITTGAHVQATVRLKDSKAITIDGGTGVGRVTRPGLDQPPGNAAINSVPRSMIEKEVREVMELFDYHQGVEVIISVTEGEELAARTFNPRLGIEGGISILGTSGIVEPMSNQALIDTIRVELKQKRAMGYDTICISPGNYGLEFMKNTYNYNLDNAVKCSNFIGVTLDMIKEMGFKRVLLAGHIGKLIKVAGGIMDTHSKEADCRMEILAAAAVRAGVSAEGVRAVLDSLSTEEALAFIIKEDKLESVMKYVMEKIDFYLNRRTEECSQIECIVYSNETGLLGMTDNAVGIIEALV